MENTYTAIINLQTILSEKYIEDLKTEFLKFYLHPDKDYYLSDEDKGIVFSHHAITNDVEYIRFENSYLDSKLWEATQNLKAEIDRFSVIYTSGRLNKYFKHIWDSFAYINETQSKIFIKFPVCTKPEMEIKKYLSSKYHFDNSIPENSFSYFKPKISLTITDLEKVYDFLIESEYLDDEIITFEEFQSIFNDKETSSKIIFNCSTELASVILKEMTNLFLDFSPTSIEKSQRFFTKQNNVLTANNLYNSYRRITKKDTSQKLKIETFFKCLLS